MAIDWTKIYKKYKGLWVALLSDEVTVVGSGETAREAWEEAEGQGHKDAILTRIPEKLTAYVGCHEISI